MSLLLGQGATADAIHMTNKLALQLECDVDRETRHVCSMRHSHSLALLDVSTCWLGCLRCSPFVARNQRIVRRKERRKWSKTTI